MSRAYASAATGGDWRARLVIRQRRQHLAGPKAFQQKHGAALISSRRRADRLSLILLAGSLAWGIGVLVVLDTGDFFTWKH